MSSQFHALHVIQCAARRLTMDTDLLLGQRHQILVDAFQDEIHIRPCHGNAAGQGFFVGLSVDVVLFQKHQPDALMIEVFVKALNFSL